MWCRWRWVLLVVQAPLEGRRQAMVVELAPLEVERGQGELVVELEAGEWEAEQVAGEEEAEE